MAEKIEYPLIWRSKTDGAYWGIVMDAYPNERAKYFAEWKRSGYHIGPPHHSLEAATEWLKNRLREVAAADKGGRHGGQN